MANFFHQLLLHSTPTLHLVAPALLEGCECNPRLVAKEIAFPVCVTPTFRPCG